ncbi:hypothetical protein CDAR_480981 [Caerostris darwini]|uniref:Uncharacterized protein n=1 Tax=Caerostris darwini TaxID=1538125 RepID=A0AAV4W716_9ARAC|nr:hypothetical protein CDAR_480981 [Caerostris darwini]
MSGAKWRKYGRIGDDETGRKCPNPNILRRMHPMIKISCADGTVVVLNCCSRKMLFWCMTWSSTFVYANGLCVSVNLLKCVEIVFRIEEERDHLPNGPIRHFFYMYII